ncbi:helix-turn-helix domain-containing protein [Dinghuibacter silviterrae]|uniref:Helix-turn-helix protein n=1 Tax=Dinghuibacter silviterrae TaxID=1539049 RepID=A0A4R8DSG4_9BACT|nr:helix-turn-helix domain-containing protein [Dinghuibacter silviterrae]TDX00355.1 helix-turn-helix protein [Dinghuibacter silviterrae]
MEYREYKPHPLLDAYIVCYWSALADSPPFRERESLIPDGTTEFMFNFGDPYHQLQGDVPATVKGAHIIGIRKRSLIISQTTRQDFFCIRFRAGGPFALFGVPAHLFAHGFYDMRDVVGTWVGELEEKLFEAVDNDDRVRITDRYLLERLGTGMEEHTFVRRCVSGLLKGGGVARVLSDAGVTYKTLERRFHRVLGLSPTELVRIHRFNNAVHAMYSGRHASLTSVGHACGYYDQAHFIRDFRYLTGYAPLAFLKEQFTIVQVIQPALAERLSKLYNF